MTPRTIKILFVSLLAAFFTVLTTAGVSAENLNIVSVDTARIMERHPAFVEAQQTFQGEMQQMQQQLQGMGEEEQMMAQQMMQQQLQQRGQELQQDAMDKVRDDIATIAGEKGYEYVVDSNALLVGGKDITEEVMAEIDLEEEGVEPPEMME